YFCDPVGKTLFRFGHGGRKNDHPLMRDKRLGKRTHPNIRICTVENTLGLLSYEFIDDTGFAGPAEQNTIGQYFARSSSNTSWNIIIDGSHNMNLRLTTRSITSN